MLSLLGIVTMYNVLPVAFTVVNPFSFFQVII